MKLTQTEINHILFLTRVAADTHKPHMLREVIKCLTYIVKAHDEIELPDEAAEHVRQIIAEIESELRQDSDKLQEIRHNLDHYGQRQTYRS